MRLQVNLIPAIAYALVTMLAQATGLTREEENKQPQQKQPSASIKAADLNSCTNYVYVSGNGQIHFPSIFPKDHFVWANTVNICSMPLFYATERM